MITDNLCPIEKEQELKQRNMQMMNLFLGAAARLTGLGARFPMSKSNVLHAVQKMIYFLQKL